MARIQGSRRAGMSQSRFDERRNTQLHKNRTMDGT
jgi:hypothetical protein